MTVEFDKEFPLSPNATIELEVKGVKDNKPNLRTLAKFNLKLYGVTERELMMAQGGPCRCKVIGRKKIFDFSNSRSEFELLVFCHLLTKLMLYIMWGGALGDWR